MIREFSTEKRDKVLQYLKKFSKKTVSIPEIMEYLKAEDIDMNKAAVYRYLERLHQQNQIIKFVPGNGNMAVFQYVGEDYKKYNHLQIQCVRCGKMTSMNSELMNRLYSRIEEDHGYELLFRNSIVYGICKECVETGGIRSEDR